MSFSYSFSFSFSRSLSLRVCVCLSSCFLFVCHVSFTSRSSFNLIPVFVDFQITLRSRKYLYDAHTHTTTHTTLIEYSSNIHWIFIEYSLKWRGGERMSRNACVRLVEYSQNIHWKFIAYSSVIFIEYSLNIHWSGVVARLCPATHVCV